MKFWIFSVYDSKAEVFNTPMFLPAKGQATRAFGDQANDPNSEIAKHPEDYTLFVIGEYESDTGLVTPLPTPESLGLALEYREVIQ